MTCANSKDINPKIEQEQQFPTDGLYIGSLRATTSESEFPALAFLRDIDGLCLLNNDMESRENINKCLERLVWRVVTTIPPNMCEISVYNGGNPGDAFNSVMQINKYFFGDQTDKIYFAGTRDAFSKRLEQLCGIIVGRMSKMSGVGAEDAVEYNEQVEPDSRMKYMFLFISDFPR